MPEWVSLKLHEPIYRAEMSFEIMVCDVVMDFVEG
jgi:hypothetical protein